MFVLSPDKIYITIALILLILVILFVGIYYFVKKVVSDELQKPKKRKHKQKKYVRNDQYERRVKQTDLDSYIDPVEDQQNDPHDEEDQEEEQEEVREPRRKQRYDANTIMQRDFLDAQ